MFLRVNSTNSNNRNNRVQVHVQPTKKANHVKGKLSPSSSVATKHEQRTTALRELLRQLAKTSSNLLPPRPRKDDNNNNQNKNNNNNNNKNKKMNFNENCNSNVDGAFCCTLPRSDLMARSWGSLTATDSESTSSSSSSSSLTSDTKKSQKRASKATTTRTKALGWQSSGQKGYHRHSPLLVSRNSKRVVTDEAEELGLIMARARKLPGTWYFASNHIMVNQERTKRIMPPLVRESALDALARQHAANMANLDRLHHSNVQELLESIMTQTDRPCRRLGENVAKGVGIREIHEAMMQLKGDKNNMLDRRYTTFGMGTARGPDGELYLCQIYLG